MSGDRGGAPRIVPGPLRWTALVALLGLGASIAVAQLLSSDPVTADQPDGAVPADQQPFLEITEDLIGTGESLVVVIAGSYPTRSTAAEAAETTYSLGEFQGFYVDQGRNYDLLGAYLPSTPAEEVVRCGSPRAVELGVVCDQPTGAEVVVRVPVELRRMSVAEAAEAIAARTAGPCPAPAGALPCPAPALVRIVATGGLDPDAFYVLTAFRTRRGAEQFLELLRDYRGLALDDVTVVQVRKLGGPYVGLGQEPAPDGSGPLLHPLPDQEAYQQ